MASSRIYWFSAQIWFPLIRLNTAQTCHFVTFALAAPGELTFGREISGLRLRIFNVQTSPANESTKTIPAVWIPFTVFFGFAL